MSKAATFNRMYTDLRDGHRVVACFASAKMLRGCMQHLQTIMDENLITGYFAAADNKDELFDVNEYWGKYKFIGYTSTVTVSLDFTEPVHRVYVLPNRNASGPREVLQGTGRSRDVITRQVIVAMDSTCRYMPLERGYDFNADYERELKFLADRRAAISSFNSLTERQRELYGTFEEELTEEGPTYTPTLYTKLWAVDRAEQALKLRSWYPHLMWMLEKKGYKVEYADEPEPEGEEDTVEEEEEEETDEVAGGGGGIIQGVSIAADAIVSQEVEDMDDIDATELDDEWEDVMNKKHTRDMLVREEKLALRKYQAQKYFTPALTGEDVAFFEKHKKAIMYYILEQDATAAELYAKNKEDVERAKRCGMEAVISQDYNVRTALLKLVKDVGYKAFDDDTTEVCPKEVGESDEIKLDIGAVQRLVGGTSKQNTTLAGVLKPWLMKYMGLKLQARRDGRGENRRSLYKMKPSPDICEFSLRENTVYDRVMGRNQGAQHGRPKQIEPDGSNKGSGSGSGAGPTISEPTSDIRQFLTIKRCASCL
ncbi:unnamed protein product [Ectocarpus fasciculatus]